MGRKKVKIAFISDLAARKATFKRRKKGLIKKVSEITTLCDVPACAMVSNPFDSSLEVWPDPWGAKQVIHKYNNASVLNQRNNVNQESYIMHMIGKAQYQLKEQRYHNHEENMTLSMIQYMQGEKLPDTYEEVKEVNKLLDKNLKEIETRLAALKCDESNE